MTVGTGPDPVAMAGPYRLERVLGQGGMGVVHLSRDGRGHPVAVKVLHPHVALGSEGRQRLSREVATMQRVRGPHVAQVLDADIGGQQPYIVTAFVPGESLDALVRRCGPLPMTQLLGLGAGLADALDSVHRAGVVHRDLKPSNVIVDAGRPVVIDFGIAQLADDVQLTRTGLFFGTPGYLAPEVVRGDRPAPAADIASWAAAMAFAATGRAPYGGGPVDVVMNRILAGQLDLAGVPGRLAPVLLAAIAPVPQRPTAPVLRHWMAQLGDSTPGTALLSTQGGPFAGSTYLLTRPQAPHSPPVRQAAAVPVQQPALPGAAAPAQPWQPPWQARAARVAGTALSAALGLLLVAMTTLAPYVGGLATVLAVLLVLTGCRCARMVERRRWSRGRRASDPVALAGSLPWHLVRSAPGTLLAVLTGAVGAGLGLLLSLGLGQLSDRAQTLPLAVGAVAGMWLGPRHRDRREGMARLAVSLRPVASAAAVVAFVVAAAVVASVAAHAQVDWFPFGSGGPHNWFTGVLSRMDSR